MTTFAMKAALPRATVLDHQRRKSQPAPKLHQHSKSEKQLEVTQLPAANVSTRIFSRTCTVCAQGTFVLSREDISERLLNDSLGEAKASGNARNSFKQAGNYHYAIIFTTRQLELAREVQDKHVLIVCGGDVDSLCSVLILTRLFACDDISYSISHVSGWTELDRVLRSHYEQNPVIVLINCGANRSLQDLQLPSDSRVFVIDSRRPIHLENVYENDRIAVVLDSREELSLQIPNETDVREVDSDEEDEESEGDDEDVEGARRGQSAADRIQQRLIKKEKKKLWDRRRKDLLWKYYEFGWHSMASSVRMLELAASLNRATSEFMWLAAVGINSQLTDKLISLDLYTDVCVDHMRPFIHRFAPREGHVSKADDVLRVSFGKDLPLAMYESWSLYEAMRVNEHFACKTRNWTQRGDTDVKHLLAHLGLTLNETKQKYGAMAAERKKEVLDSVEQEMGGTFATFFAHLGYCARTSAADVARAVAARLESPRHEPLGVRFALAEDSIAPFLGRVTDMEPLRKAITIYQHGLEVVWSLLATAINQAEVIPTGPFYLYSCPRMLPDDLLESRHFLYVFSNFLLKAFMAAKPNRRIRPMIIALPLTTASRGWHIPQAATQNWNLVTGVMPEAAFEGSLKKSFIGSAFSAVSKLNGMNEALLMDSFDSDIVLLKSAERARFFDCLQSVLER